MRYLMPLIWLLGGCPYVSDSAFERVRDYDGDGEWSERFGGRDCRDHDPNIVSCDADGDGFLATTVGGDDCDDGRADVFPGADEVCDEVDNDCDGAIDAGDTDLLGGTLYYADVDGDQFGDPDLPGRHCAASPPAGWTTAAQAKDCDDGAPAINPPTSAATSSIATATATPTPAPSISNSPATPTPMATTSARAPT